MSRAVMQQAFDAMSYGNTTEREAARIALREALAQPVQEPVAWFRYEDGMRIYYETKALDDLQALYPAPPQRQPLTPEKQGYVPLSDDGKSVFIDGCGEVPLAYPSMQPPLPAQPQPIGEGFFLPGQEPVLMQERRAKRMSGGVVTQWSSWYSSKYRTPDEAKADEFFADHIPHEWRHLYVETPQPKPQPEQPEQPEQEPVARVNDDGFIVETGLLIAPGTLLYTTPPLPAQPVQEPVAWVTVEDGVWVSTRSADFRHIADGQYQLYVGPLQNDGVAAISTLKALGYAYNNDKFCKEGEQWISPHTTPPQPKPLTDDLLGLLKEARKIIRASSSRNLVKDWDARATSAIAAHNIGAKQ